MAVGTSSRESHKLLTIDQFVQGLRELRETDFNSVPAPLDYMRKSPIDPDSLQPYLFWSSQHYTRNLVDKTELYELLAICWEVGMKSSVHNHKGQNCWVGSSRVDLQACKLEYSIVSPK